jgi:RNA polymerase sigma-70 factor, ECF subfamily
MIDKELVARAAAGDVDCRNEIFERCVELTFAICLRYANGDPIDAEDLTQQVFMKVFDHISSFDEPYDLKAWVARIAHNCGIDHVRSVGKGRLKLGLMIPLIESPVGPEQKMIQSERVQLLRRAIELEGDTDLARTATLFYEEGLTSAEISEETGLTVTAVTTRLARYRSRLRKRLIKMMMDIET